MKKVKKINLDPEQCGDLDPKWDFYMKK